MFLLLFFSLSMFINCTAKTKKAAEDHFPVALLPALSEKTPLSKIPLPETETNKPLLFSQYQKGMDSLAFAQKMVEGMNDYEVVGQLFMFTYASREADEEIIQWISKKKIGNIKIFGWNGVDLGEICRSVTVMQEAALKTEKGIPLIIATDQEGGWVRHVKATTSTTPGNMSIGAAGNLTDAYLSSYYIAQELRTIGINMNFTPTVDLFIEHQSNIIGSRAFSEDPILTANLAKAFFKGHEAQRVIATAKHFPGHGNSKDDSHGRLPVIDSDLAFLKANDLVPYQYLIHCGIPAIMVGHIAFPQITGTLEPATLSHKLITQLLRKQYHFDQIVITDDLNMAGMSKEGIATAHKSLEALMAGNDIVLISKNRLAPSQYQTQWESVFNEYQKNEEFRIQAKKSAIRILKIKLEYLADSLHVPFFPDEKKAIAEIPSPESENFFFNQACRSLTQLSSNRLVLPKKSKILLAGYNADFFAEGEKWFSQIGKINTYASMEKNGTSGTANQIITLMKNFDYLILCVEENQSLTLAKQIKKTIPNLSIITTFVQGDLKDQSDFANSLMLYGLTAYSCKAAYAVLTGDFTPRGKLPYTIGEKP